MRELLVVRGPSEQIAKVGDEAGCAHGRTVDLNVPQVLQLGENVADRLGHRHGPRNVFTVPPLIDEVQGECHPFLGLQMDSESTVDDFDSASAQFRLIGIELTDFPFQGKIDDGPLLSSVHSCDEVIEDGQHHPSGMGSAQLFARQFDDCLCHSHLGVSGVR